MSKIGISFYYITLYNDKKSTDLIKPENIGFKQVIHDYLIKLKEKEESYIKDDSNKSIRILKSLDIYESKINDVHNYYGINAIIKTGHYGELGNIIDKDDFTETDLTTNQAVIKPFGVSFFYSKSSDVILVAFESVGQNPNAKIIEEITIKAVKAISKDFIVNFKKFVPHNFFNSLFEQQDIKKIYFLTSSHKNNTDNVDNLVTEDKIISEEQEIIFRKPKIHSKIKNILKSVFCDPSKKVDSLVELTDFSEDVEIDDVKIEFNNKSIRYSRLSSVKITEDISKELEYIENSVTPTPASLFKAILNHSIVYMDFLNIANKIENEQREYYKEGDTENDPKPSLV